MKIAMVSEHANPLAVLGGVDAGGQNVHVAALATHLCARGHDVTVFTRRDNTSPRRRLTAPSGYAVDLVPAGPPTDIPKDELLPYMPAFGEYLTERLAMERFDVIHAHFWMSGLAAVSAARKHHIPVVQTYHALGTVKRRQQGDRDSSPAARIALESALCNQVDHVIATCRDEVTELESMGLAPGRVSVVPCGVDVRSASPPPLPSNERPRLLVLGRLVERKGVGNVVEALAQLPGVELVIAGGPDRDMLSADPQAVRLRELAVALGVSDRVTFVGRVSHDHVPALIRTADVVVAVPWYEPFGIVPLEAMACGRPVVGSAVGGLLDTIVPGVTGELVPPRRPDVLAKALRGLLDDPSRRRSYGAAGFQRACDHYQWAHVAELTDDVYGAVLSKHDLSSIEVF